MYPNHYAARGWWATVILSAAMIGCDGRTPPSGDQAEETHPMTATQSGGGDFKLTSPAFENGRPIPRKFTGEGKDVSPRLAWSGAPEGTKQFALICDDPDAPSPRNPAPEPWVHWVLYNIPADRDGLDEAVADVGAAQGQNSWPRQQYNGPMPPPGSGRHRYFFRLYALDAVLNLPAGLTARQLRERIAGHVLGRAEWMGTYQR